MLRPADIVDLGEWLRGHDFVVSAQQLVAASRLVSGLRAPEDEAALAPWLAPVFCTNSRQQIAFAQHYGDWLRQRRPPETEPRKGRGNRVQAPRMGADLPTSSWRRVRAAVTAMVVLLLLAAAATLAVHRYQRHELRIEVRGPGGVLEDARVAVNNGATVLRTDSGGSTAMSYRRVDLPLQVSATHTSVREGSQLRSAEATVERVLEEPLRLVLTPPAGPGPPPPPDVAHARWLLSLPPPQPLQGPDIEEAVRRLDSTRLVLLVAAGVLPVLWWALATLRRRGFLERLPSADSAPEKLLQAQGTRPLAGLLAELRSLGRDLRRRVLVPSRQIDVSATLRATLRGAGLVRLVFGTRTEPEHLVLVDRAGPVDHQAQLADDAVAALHRQNVILERYVFDDDPRTCYHAPVEGQPAHLGPQSLERLAGRHPSARLLVFSDGRGLIDPRTGMPAQWVTQFQAWAQPMLVTPLRRELWGVREWLLGQAGMVVIPLDSVGLRMAADVLGTQRETPSVPAGAREQRRPAYLRDVPRLLDREAPEPELVDELAVALRRDLGEEGFAWLCGCAVYPEVHWSTTLAVGEAVADSAASTSTEAPTGDLPRRLADLVRLPWLRHGTMPDWLREALLARFPQRHEAAVRKALAQFLERLKLASKLSGGDTLAVTTPARRKLADQPLDLWRGLTSMWKKSQAAPPAAHDRVFLRFMSSGHRLLRLPATQGLLRLLYREGVPLLGPQALVPVVMLALASATALWEPPLTTQILSRPGELREPRPNALALDAAGTAVVIADDAGGLRRYAVRDGQLQSAARPFSQRDTAATLAATEMEPLARQFLGDDAASRAQRAIGTLPDGPCLPPSGSQAADTSSVLVQLRRDAAPAELIACASALGGATAVALDSSGGVHLAQSRPGAAEPRVQAGTAAVASTRATSGPWTTERVGRTDPGFATLAVSDDGRMIAMRRPGDDIELLRGVNHLREVLAGSGGSAGPIALSGDGRVLAAVDTTGRVDLWQLTPAAGRDLLLAISSDGGGLIKSPRDDLALAVRVLRQRYGFSPTVLENPTRAEVLRRLRALAAQTDADDRLIVFFSGTGDGGTWGFGAGLTDRMDALDGAEIAAILRAVPARQVLVVNDTVRAGALASKGAPSKVTGATRLVLSATDAAQLRNDDNEFARAFFDVLATTTKPLTAVELRDAIAARRGAAAGETAMLGEWPAAGHDRGEFMLRPTARPMPALPRVEASAAQRPASAAAEDPASQASAPALAGGEWRLLHVLRGHEGDVERVSWSPDSRWLVSTSMPSDNPRIWDAATGAQVGRINNVRGSWVARFALGGRLLLVGDSSRLEVFDFASGNARARGAIAIDGRVRDIAVAPAGDAFVILESSGNAQLLRVDAVLDALSRGQDTEAVRVKASAEYRSPANRTYRNATWRPDGTVWFADGLKEPILAWAADGSASRVWPSDDQFSSAIAFSRDGRLAASEQSFKVRVRDGRTLAALRTIDGSVRWALAFSADASQLLVGTGDGAVRRFNPLTGLELAPPLLGHSGQISDISLSPNGAFVATASDDRTVRIWSRADNPSPAGKPLR